MAKRALCVGVNDYPGVDNDLNGCVNDAKAWAALLPQHFGFAPGDVKILLDAEATKKAIVDGLHWLLKGAKAGDVLVYTNSSHGTYVADESGDEAYDEAICPYDCDTELLLDDELRELLAKLPDGVSFALIADNCHSGTLTRAAVSDNLPDVKYEDDRRVRFLNPALLKRRMLADPWSAKPRRGSAYAQASMKELLLSGCSPREYSYDAYFGGVYHGALSYYALKAIREADYRMTWAQLHARVRYLLEDNGYAQHPQLEGTPANKRKQIFS